MPASPNMAENRVETDSKAGVQSKTAAAGTRRDESEIGGNGAARADGTRGNDKGRGTNETRVPHMAMADNKHRAGTKERGGMSEEREGRFEDTVVIKRQKVEDGNKKDWVRCERRVGRIATSLHCRDSNASKGSAGGG